MLSLWDSRLAQAPLSVLDAIDSSLRTVDEAESYLELPALASIPDRRPELMDAAKTMVRERDFSAASLGISPNVCSRRRVFAHVNGIDPPKKRNGKG